MPVAAGDVAPVVEVGVVVTLLGEVLFVVAGLAFGRLTSAIARARRGLWIVELVGGAVLVIFGVLLVTDHLGWLSSQFTTLLDHIGLGRLSTS